MVFKSGSEWEQSGGNSKGRPKEKTIKERVREWLEEHPDDMESFVKHFVKKNKELAWQMLEGRPQQETDITSGGKPIYIPSELIPKNDLPQSTEPDSE